MHGGMEPDVALAAVHCADPRGGCHVDAIGQAGHLVRPIPAHISISTALLISPQALLVPSQTNYCYVGHDRIAIYCVLCMSV